MLRLIFHHKGTKTRSNEAVMPSLKVLLCCVHLFALTILYPFP